MTQAQNHSASTKRKRRAASLAPAAILLALTLLAGAWLTLPSLATRNATYEAPKDAGASTLDAPLVILRGSAPALQIGRASSRAQEGGVVKATLFDGRAAPDALLVTDATPPNLWALLPPQERSRILTKAGALSRPLLATLRNLRGEATPQEMELLREAARQTTDLLSRDPEALAASQQLADAFNDSFGPAAKPIAGTFASKVGRSAVTSAGSFIKSLFGATIEAQPTITEATLRDPVVQDALVSATENLLRDPRSRAALPVLASRALQALTESPALAEAARLAYEHPALRRAFEELARDTTSVAIESFAGFLQLSEKPELNPVAATLVNATLRRRPARLVVALDAAALERLESEGARWRPSIYRRRK